MRDSRTHGGWLGDDQSRLAGLVPLIDVPVKPIDRPLPFQVVAIFLPIGRFGLKLLEQQIVGDLITGPARLFAPRGKTLFLNGSVSHHGPDAIADDGVIAIHQRL